MEWVARRLQPEDAAGVAEVSRRSRRDSMPWLPVLHSPDEDIAFFGSELETSTGWAVDIDGQPVGFALTRDGWLTHLYVLPEWQRRGVGTHLLRRVVESEIGPLDLWVFERNEAARDFYRAHGFAEVERTEGSGNEEQEPDVRMRRPAGEPWLVIRDAAPADVEGIARAHVVSWQGAYAGLLPQQLLAGLDWRDRVERWQDRLAESGRVRIVVAEAGGRVVGFCAVGPARDEDLVRRPETWFELYSIYLVPDRWASGLGRRLWAAARAGIPSDVEAVSLWVLEGNQRARAFYEREGFRPEGRRELTTRLGLDVPEIRYAWRIPAPGE